MRIRFRIHLFTLKKADPDMDPEDADPDLYFFVMRMRSRMRQVQCLAAFSGSLAETMGGTSGGIYSLLFTAAARAFQASI
jgi:hypothetical protein